MFKQVIYFVIFLCLTMQTFLMGSGTESVHYQVTKQRYTFSTSFEMANARHSMGSVIKSIFHLTTNYDAYDQYGLYEGQGVCRFFCLGLFYKWATEIDVYNDQGSYVGFIDGQVATSEPAKFSFYNAERERVAIAYLDQDCLGFKLINPNQSNEILAHLRRNFIPDVPDYWDVNIYNTENLSLALVKIFAAFACDTQDSFRKDN